LKSIYLADKKQNVLDIAKSDKAKDDADQTDKQSQQEKAQVPAPNVETKKNDAKGMKKKQIYRNEI